VSLKIIKDWPRSYFSWECFILLSNKITNFAGFISTGINSVGLRCYAQVINDKPFYSYWYMRGRLAEIQSTLMQLETTLV
jgi:hypothetical protein